MSVATASYWSGSIINAATASYVENAQSASYVQNAQTASYVVQAQSASYWSGSIINSATASYIENAQSASYVLNAQSASYWSGSITNAATASYVVTSQTASYVLNAVSASFALTASYISGSGAGVGFPFSGSAIITGSLFVSGSTISGSFVGDGSGITGLTAGGKIHTQTSAASTWTVSHNLGVQYPNVTVYDNNNNVIIPQTIVATDANTLTLTFGSAVAGYAVAGIGGIINVQGRTTQQYFTASTTWSFAHNLGDKYVSLQAFDDAFEMMIPTTIRLVDFTSSLLLFDSASSGYAVATIGGDLPAISSSYAGYTLQIASSAPYSASWVAIPNVTVTNAVSSSFAATASSADNLTVRGTLTAQTINVQTITSSIDFVTGSTRFGSLSTNTHQFTGSVLMSGSLNVGSSVTAAKILADTTLDGDPQLGFFTNASTGSSAEAVIYIKNGATTNDATFVETTGTGFTTTGGFVQDGGIVGTGTALAGGLSLMVRANADMRFYTNGHTNERMRITSAGNVAIGRTSAEHRLDLQGNALIRNSLGNASFFLAQESDNSSTFYQYNNATLRNVISSNGNSYFNGGNVGIGTSSPAYKLEVSNAGQNFVRFSNTSSSADVGLYLTNTVVNGYFGINASEAYVYTATSHPILFYTNAVERMRIKSEGNIRIGTSTANPTELLEVNSSSGGSATHYTLFLYNTRSGGQSSGDFYVRFYSNTVNGSIRANGAGGIDYNTTSDSRLKLDPKDFNAISIINKMKPKNFKWKDYNITSEGFYAQELYDVYPQAVSVGNDELTEDGKLKNPWQIDHSKLVPVLVKAIQELSAKNTTLEERLTALENK
jgi:hypothetical protein